MAYTPIVRFPEVNPIKFVRATNKADYFWEQTIPFFEDQKKYVQKFQQSDYILFQICINQAVINKYALIIQLRDAVNGDTYGTFTPEGDMWVDSDHYVNLTYRLNLYNPLIPEGEYYIYIYMPYLTGGANYELFYSEPLSIKATHTGTVQIKYTNYGNDFDTFFYKTLAGLDYHYFIMRVEGGFRSDGYLPGSNDASFIDQTHNAELLSSTPFDTYKLTIGSNRGIPNWVAKRVNRILCCTHVYLDGVQYCKNEGAKWEAKFYPPCPMASWKIDMVKAINDYYSEHVKIFTKIPGGTAGQIGNMIVGDTFIISPTVDPTGITATPTHNYMTRPFHVPNLNIPAGVETPVEHDAGTANIVWQFRDGNNEVQFSTNKIDPANPTTKILVYSEIAYTGLTLNGIAFD